MDPLLLGYIGLFAGSGLLCLVSVPRARSIHHPGTREGLVGLLVSVALWCAGYTGYLVAPTDTAKIACYIFGFVFAFVAVGAWLYFCAAYTGRGPRRAPYRRVLVGVFLLLVGLKVTNPVHGLYFTTAWTEVPFPYLAIEHQLLYWIVLGLSYAVIAVGFFMLLERFYYTGTDSRPLLLLAGVTAVPAAVTIFSTQFDGLLPLMYEPPGVALFSVGTLFVYKRRFEAIRLTGGTDEPAIFLDGDGRIRDYNQAARDLLPSLAGSVGTQVDSVSSVLADALPNGGVVTVTNKGEPRFYEISTAPFTSGGMETGRLVTITDVTDRESYRRRLEEKTEELEALNRVVRHDIRNDMAVILSWSEMLEDHVDEEGRDALDRVVRKSRHVVELTELARDFVESLTGEGTAKLEPVDLAEILESELATARDSYPNASFRVSGPLPPVTVQANQMLSSVFRNLFTNAVQHNNTESPSVIIDCEETDSTVRVRVADNGPGIPAAQQEGLFGKGNKGIESTGTGIGLYLVKTLTEQYGGRVWYEENDPSGSIFVVELARYDESDQ